MADVWFILGISAFVFVGGGILLFLLMTFIVYLSSYQDEADKLRQNTFMDRIKDWGMSYLDSVEKRARIRAHKRHGGK